MSRRRGFTLAELMVALAITAMIGSAISAMLVSVSTGTEARADTRRLEVRHKLLATRIDEAIRESRMVLDAGSGFLVLWMDDGCENGLPNLCEIRRIDWDVSTSEVSAYRAPEGLASADDTLYGFAADYDAITGSLMGTASFPGEVWATSVTSWELALDAPAAQDSVLVSYSLVIEDQGATTSTTHCASLRGR